MFTITGAIIRDKNVWPSNVLPSFHRGYEYFNTGKRCCLGENDMIQCEWRKENVVFL